MNLQAAADLAKLREPNTGTKVKPKVRSAAQVAKRVHQLAAEGGFPYTGRTVEQWQKKFLSSSEFILMEIDLNAPASPHKPRNPDRVQHYLNCSKDSLDPIVVDLNKCKTGKTLLGYIPEVITIDGKHRSESLRRLGHTKVLAWVGCKAVKKLRKQKVINASHHHNELHGIKLEPSKITTAYALSAAVGPSVGIPSVRQDAGEGGSRPKDHMHSKSKKKVKKVKSGDCNACGARSSGTLVDDTSNSDKKIPPDESDTKQAVDESDRLKWDGNKPNMVPPAARANVAQFVNQYQDTVPLGSKPKTLNKGASGSEISRVYGKGKKINKLFEKGKGKMKTRR